ncbi:hypothetical protein GEMRC1_009195 [Eukaryota sp. GEM-RC1]
MSLTWCSFLSVLNIQALVAVFVLTGITFVQTRYRKVLLKSLSQSNHPRFSEPLPMISVVLVCKGTHSESLTNWESSLKLHYQGPLEHIFVVESTSDPAYSAINSVISHHNNCKLVVAGLSFHNAQKIHNQIAGIAACSPDSSFVLFTDDDIRVHSGVYEQLVLSFQDPQVFAATGYCFEAPSNNAGFWGLLLMHYRLLNLGSFTGRRTRFMWGGFMMFELSSFRNNLYNILDLWRDGGYSDDMATVSVCSQYNRTIASHPMAVFPNPLTTRISFSKYLGFLSRQLFVCTTYSSTANKIQNLLLLWLNPLSFIGFGLPFILATCTLLMFILSTITPIIPQPCTGVVFSSLSLVLGLGIITKTLISLIRVLKQCNEEVSREHVSFILSTPFIKTGLALVMHLLLAAFVALYHCFSKTNKINWAGVVYQQHQGRINKVSRNEYSINAPESVKQALIEDQKKGLVVPGVYPRYYSSVFNDDAAGIGLLQ